MSTEQNNGKPAVPPKRNLLNDRRIRLLLSLLGAVIAWMAVTIVVQPGTTTTIYNVPVDFSYDSAAYTSRGLSIVNAEEKTVNLKLSGDGYTIGSLSANDFVVYPDWSSVRDSGEKSLRLQVRSQSTLLTGVSVSIDGDNTVDVVFDVVEEKTLPIQVTTNYLKIADGYILYGTDISKETVTLSGPSTELSKRAAGDIQRAETERLVHRHERLSETRDTRLVTDALRQCLTERNAAVLDRMMAVHLEVALAGEREAEAGMHGKAVQHMVEKADAGVDPAFAALKRQLERNVGFLGLSFDFSGSHCCFPPQSAPRWSLRARPSARSARAR